ncbi:MAG TPA: glycosyltransferase [Chlorobaculum parvum]|uniref:Glycosyltransferase n=1 Tax=Chlorobaculum parvum TaxID=274539 RepID=A0A7C5HQN5_9CHLB|nr:glycosyltransferase [Chlorobaculum parvum]
MRAVALRVCRGGERVGHLPGAARSLVGAAGCALLGPSDRIEEVYSQADCVVLPSYREGMPRSLLEAGAMGLPVVATNVPGCRNIVADGHNGLLCEAKSAESLRNALEAMLALSPEERSRMGAAGRRQVEQAYDEQLVVKAALDVLDGLRGRGT